MMIIDKCLCINSKSLPVGTIIALLVTWIGLVLFSTKLYEGATVFADLAGELLAFLIPLINGFKIGLIVFSVIMFIVTLFIAVFGYFATKHSYNAYKDDPNEIKWGSKAICRIFVVFTYVLYLCWLGILSIVVVITSAYVGFMPLCVPDAGHQSTYCLNFSMMSLLLHQQHGTPYTKLVLCGEALDKFCRLTKCITPWYGGAYVGCIAVLMGLSHFHSCMAANFAHGTHAIRYRKWHSRRYTRGTGTVATGQSVYTDATGCTSLKDNSGAVQL